MNASITKIFVFTILGGIGAFIGSLLGYPIAENASGFADLVVKTGLWDALIAVGIGIAFVLSQSWYLKRLQTGGAIARIAGMCAIAGFAGGAVLIVLRHLMQDFPDAVSLIIAWGFEGAIIGFLIAPVIPNLPRLSALVAGGLAGVLGAITMMGVNVIGIGGATSVAIGDSLKGIFLGFLFTLTETLVREAWLEIHYAPKEVRNVSLGTTPIGIGSDPQLATIYTASAAPLALRYRLQQGQIICEDIPAQTTRQLADGDQQILGKLKVVVRTAQPRRELAAAPVATAPSPTESDAVQSPQTDLSLHLRRQVFPLPVGTRLRSQDIPGLEPQNPDRTVAEVSHHPQDPSTLGLKNTSHQVWSATLPSGEQKRIEPGRTIKLAAGTRINFGAVEGEIKP